MSDPFYVAVRAVSVADCKCGNKVAFLEFLVEEGTEAAHNLVGIPGGHRPMLCPGCQKARPYRIVMAARARKRSSWVESIGYLDKVPDLTEQLLVRLARRRFAKLEFLQGRLKKPHVTPTLAEHINNVSARLLLECQKANASAVALRERQSPRPTDDTEEFPDVFLENVY